MKISYLKQYTAIFIITFFFTIIFISCSDETGTPKPRAYFRIDLPEKSYHEYDTTFPYKFEYPVYSKIIPDWERKSEPYWLNIDFPKYKGRIHLSYKVVNNNLSEYIEQSRSFAQKHIPKANEINQEIYINDEYKVYGMIYDIKGSGAASTYQFYLTDSVKHFVRGALYFNMIPNNDSIAPVISFIKEDIKHMITTFEWK